MKTIQEIVTPHIHEALENLGISDKSDIHFEHPKELSYGDYSTNIAMVLAKNLQKNPQELAQGIVDFLNKKEIPYLEGISVAGPGFININLSEKFFSESLDYILSSKENFGRLNILSGKKVLVEHSSPNLFKAFHIGHLMNNTIGEALVRLYRYSGAQVSVVSYPSDVSLGIAKAIWELLEQGVSVLQEVTSINEKIAKLGDCYVKGTKAYDDRPEIQARIREITLDIYTHKDTEAYRAYLMSKEINLEYFKEITSRLGSQFDEYIFESEAGVEGKKIVMDNIPDVYTESDGAVVYQGEQDGLHTRVFINKEGNPTYEAKDTGLLKIKFERYNPDLSVFVTDHQQSAYFQVVAAAAGKINPTWKEKTIHATHGRMQFKGEKMSSRLGNTPLVSDILQEVNKEVYARSGERDLSESQADAISLAALKYTILRTQAGKDINFDPDTSLSFEGDSGPYLQYTHARSSSLLQKAHDAGILVSADVPDGWELIDLQRVLYRFPEVVQQALDQRQPHHIVTYLTELSQLFNSWYGSTKIVDTEDLQSGYKLALTQATAQVLNNGLWLLGIQAPKQM